MMYIAIRIRIVSGIPAGPVISPAIYGNLYVGKSGTLYRLTYNQLILKKIVPAYLADKFFNEKFAEKFYRK
jgi:hypothetical protein